MTVFPGLLSGVARRLLLGAALLLGALPVGAFRADPDRSGAVRASIRPPTPPARAISAAQSAAAQQAEAAGMAVSWDARLGVPRSLRGRNLGFAHPAFASRRAALAGATPEDKAIAVLDALGGLYALRDAATEFTPKATQRDALGFRHVRLTQRHAGLNVVGGELIVHFDARGEAYEVNGPYVADIDVDARPVLDAAAAEAAARRDLAGLGKPPAAAMLGPERVIFAYHSAPRLAYELTLLYDTDGRMPGRWRYWIDARTGGVLLRFNDVPLAAFPTEGTHTNLSGARLAGEGGAVTNVIGWHNTPNDFYYLYNTNFPWIVFNAAAVGYFDNGSFAYRIESDWGVSDRTEISAAVNFDKIQRYFANVHARSSFDNARALATVNVHYGDHYANAYWNGVDFTFGDGDDDQFAALTVLDVAAHEFTHAVTEYSVNLYYDYYESGALNESFSDIFGTCAEFHSQPSGASVYPNSTPGRSDWLMGEDACLPPYRALRDLRDPSGDGLIEGRHPSRYRGFYWDPYGEMHVNSTVQSFMFYLLCEGGSGENEGIAYAVNGISITNAEQIAYRALTVYLTPYACYADAQSAWMSAAADLNSDWVASVQQAWAAVGFTDTPSSALGEAVNAPDLSWQTGGNSNWFAQASVTHDGVMAAQSAPITNDRMSKLYARITGPVALQFWWKVSSEAEYDFLTFSVDGVPLARISGETDWNQMAFALGAGAHVMQWDYKKDHFVSEGADAGWLDEVVIRLPLALTASYGDFADRVALSWVPLPGAGVYEIWRAQGVADPALARRLATTAATSYNDTDALPGMIYYYWIKALGATGEAAPGWKSWAFIPTGVSASDGVYTNKVRIAWTPAANAVSYTVYRNTQAADSGAAAIGNTVTIPYDDTSAAPGTTYYYWVKGLDAQGAESGFSLPDSGWRLKAPEPDPEATNIPALRATDFQLTPTAIQLGAPPDAVVIRIINTSEAATSAWVNLSLVLSPGGVFGAADNIALGSLRRFVNLAAGQSVDLGLTAAERAPLRIPNTTPLGSYAAFLKATTTRPSSTNNILTLATRLRVVASRLANRHDFDGDGKSDLALYHPGSGLWHIRGSATGVEAVMACGGPGCLPVAGDYDGDGKSDLAVYQPSSGAWMFLLSASLYNAAMLADAAAAGCVPVAGDFDGDGKDDPALFNTETGAWTVRLSGSGYASASAALDAGGRLPVAGDYDGDGKSDPAVFHPAGGQWALLLSGSGYAPAAAVFGDADSASVSGDFDGDLKSDPAIYRETDGLWAVMMSAGNYAPATARFGEPGFVAVSGDYDGDGKTDLAVYQSGYGHWYFRLSKSGYPVSYQRFGEAGFVPIAAGD